jgi:NAD(P)H-hydrate repair Nnr-like enzyme with NAD(P)H-hydrate epimerase domain
MSAAGNYPDCEICHYKAAYDEETQSLDNWNGQKTPTSTAQDAIALLKEAQSILDGVDGFRGRGRLMEIVAAVIAQQHLA